MVKGFWTLLIWIQFIQVPTDWNRYWPVSSKVNSPILDERAAFYPHFGEPCRPSNLWKMLQCFWCRVKDVNGHQSHHQTYRFEDGGAAAFGGKGPVVQKRMADYEAHAAAGTRDGAVVSRGWVLYTQHPGNYHALSVIAVRCPMFIDWLFWFVRFDIDLQRYRKWQLAIFALFLFLWLWCTQFHLRRPWECLNLTASVFKGIHFTKFIEEVPSSIGYRIQPDVNNCIIL